MSPTPANPSESAVTDNTGREVITERFPNRAVKIQRSIRQDRERNYVNDGPWTMFDEQGNVAAQGEYLDGRRHGDWMRVLDRFAGAEAVFQPPFTSQAHFEHGELHGTWTVVDSQQRIVGSWEFERGVLHGTVTLWYPEGQQRQEMHFARGIPNGEATAWKRDGSIAVREFYRDGEQLVPVVTWHDKQQKESEGWMIRSSFTIDTEVDWWNGIVEIVRQDRAGEDQRTGKWTEWYPNGIVRYTGSFENGAPIGEHVWWHENGQRRVAGTYQNGNREGRWTTWHTNGHKQEEGEFLAGVKDGTWTVWSESGEIVDAEQLTASEQVMEGPELSQPYSHISITQ
jgi:antitoxin component YwqK of YwqJK toxin-antitoxin module